MFKKYKFNDPLMINAVYSYAQRNMAWPAVAAAGVGAVGSVAASAVESSGSGGSGRERSTFSRGQKAVDQDLTDFLLGRKRNSKGHILSQNPILSDLLNRVQPKRMVAGFTDTQKALFDKGRGKIEAATNRQRPDLDFVGKVRGEILGNALGNTGTTEPFVAGEGGNPEIIIPKGDGSVEVIPNAQTFSSREELERVMGESKEITDKLNIEGKAQGTDRFRRRLTTDDGQDFFFNEGDFSGGGGGFDTNTVRGAAGDAAFQNYVNSRFGATDDPALFTDDNRQGKGGNELGRINKAFGNINDLPFQNKKGGLVHKGLNEFKTQTLSDFFNTLENVTDRQEITDMLAGVEDLDALRGFFNESDSNKFGFGGAGNLTLSEGQLGFADPFGVDAGNLQAGIEAFNARTTEAPTSFEPGNFTGTLGKLTTGGVDVNNFQDFNTFLDSYAGGALQGQGLRFDPATGQLAFDQSAAGNVIGIDAATDAFLASQAEGGDDTVDDGTGGAGDEATPEENAGQVLSDALTPTLTALAGQTFDAQSSNQIFQDAVADPSRTDFQENTVPAIRETFAGGNLFGSQREQSEQRSRQALDKNLATERAKFVSNEKNNFHARQQVAIDQAMDLAALPTSIANAKINGDAVKASIVGTFANIEIQEALTNSDITNAELSSLVLLQNYFLPEQIQQDKEWQNSYINAVSGPGGLDIGAIIGLYTNKLNQNELAIV